MKTRIQNHRSKPKYLPMGAAIALCLSGNASYAMGQKSIEEICGISPLSQEATQPEEIIIARKEVNDALDLEDVFQVARGCSTEDGHCGGITNEPIRTNRKETVPHAPLDIYGRPDSRTADKYGRPDYAFDLQYFTVRYELPAKCGKKDVLDDITRSQMKNANEKFFGAIRNYAIYRYASAHGAAEDRVTCEIKAWNKLAFYTKDVVIGDAWKDIYCIVPEIEYGNIELTYSCHTLRERSAEEMKRAFCQATEKCLQTQEDPLTLDRIRSVRNDRCEDPAAQMP